MLTVRAAPEAPVPVSSIACEPAVTPRGTENAPVTMPALLAVSVPSVIGSERKTTVTCPCHPDEVTVNVSPGAAEAGDTVPPIGAVKLVVEEVLELVAGTVLVVDVLVGPAVVVGAAVVVVVGACVVVVGAAVVVVVGAAVVVVGARVVVVGAAVVVVVGACVVVVGAAVVVVVGVAVVVVVGAAVVVVVGARVVVVGATVVVVGTAVVVVGAAVVVVVGDDVVLLVVVELLVVVGGVPSPATHVSPLGSPPLAAKVITLFQNRSCPLGPLHETPMLYVPAARVIVPLRPSMLNRVKSNCVAGNIAT